MIKCLVFNTNYVELLHSFFWVIPRRLNFMYRRILSCVCKICGIFRNLFLAIMLRSKWGIFNLVFVLCVCAFSDRTVSTADCSLKCILFNFYIYLILGSQLDAICYRYFLHLCLQVFSIQLDDFCVENCKVSTYRRLGWGGGLSHPR